MPTTIRRTRHSNFVIGVDGCRGGWVFVRLCLDDEALVAGFEPKFSNILNGNAANARMTMIDMPMGLVERGRRNCEVEARKLLKPLRHSSVFSSPRRPMLYFETYGDANEWGKVQEPDGGGLSRQAWMITPKIREIDQAVAPADQQYLCEGHPEIAFLRLNGGVPCEHSKHTAEGEAERRTLLVENGIDQPEDLYKRLRAEAGARGARDDVYDACALALTAKARLDGAAIHLTDGARDACGLVMEIWG